VARACITLTPYRNGTRRASPAAKCVIIEALILFAAGFLAAGAEGVGRVEGGAGVAL